MDRTISALNAVIGDYLARRGNGLAIEMGLRLLHGEPLRCERGELARAHPRATERVAILVHGLGDSEAVWRFPLARETSYGALLAEDLGYTPFYVRYNTGLHVSENGEALAELLERLCEAHPVPLRELVVVGHSMGGLVARSACEAARRERRRWVGLLTHAFYLGTPHLGAPFERLGLAVGRVLRAIPNAYVKVVADVAELRSSGIKDLGEANLVREHWEGAPKGGARGRAVVPLLPGVAHHAIVGTLTEKERHVLTLLLGDAVVPVASAAGRSTDEARALGFQEANVKVFPGIGHRRLAHDPLVYRQLQAWCAGEGA